MLAYLIGLGQRSNRIPGIVLIVVLFAVINTDWLGWFRLNRYIAYVGMISGAGLAILEFFNGRQIDQLYSVANLLVYVQIPLMFQKKDQRIFDNWGIFLMLEIVVASLLNDNLLFGLLLIPVLVVGCSAMMSLATYSSIQQGGTSATESAGWIPNFLRWLGQEQSWARRSSGIRMMGLKPKEILSAAGVLSRFRLGWLEGLPIGLVITMFALIYFFALPRLHTGAYEGLGKAKSLVGFSGTISLDDIGELMSNDDIALRVSLSDVVTKRTFQPIDPPYIRGTVADTYDGSGRWHSELENFSNANELERLPSTTEIPSKLKQVSDRVLVTVTEQAQVADMEFSIPPFFSVDPTSDLRYTRRDWGLRSNRDDDYSARNRRRYEFETRCYFEGKQYPFLIEAGHLSSADDGMGSKSHLASYLERLKAIDRKNFPGLIQLVDDVLVEKSTRSDLEKVLVLEDFLATSTDFKYSLLPSADRSRTDDPIEDFANRHKTGHCQFFASTLAIMLRSQNIPSRIVLGFRPPEFNDVGRFFVVRQNHAHSWVEAWISQDQLQSNAYTVPEWITHGAWIRLDPTPRDENSNAGGSLRSSRGQAFQAVEQLWQDLVIDMDSSRQSDAVGIFALVGNGSIGVLLRNVERKLLQLQTQNLDSVSLETNQWFSWKSGLFAMTMAFMLIIAVQFRSRFSGFQPWKRFTGIQRKMNRKAQSLPVFFLRLNSSLARLGLKRVASQTPLEFAGEAEHWLSQHDFYKKMPNAESLIPLDSIITTFYNLRYGHNIEPTDQELKYIDRKIAAIEKFSVAHHKQYFRIKHES